MEKANGLAQIAGDLQVMLNDLTSSWEGKAASSARDALNGLASFGLRAGRVAAGIGTAVIQASAAADHVRGLPPPKLFDAGEALLAGLSGGPDAMVKDIQKQSAEAEKVRQEQIAYLKSYTTSMSAVDSHTPTFEPAPPVVNSGGGDSHHHSTGGGVHYLAPKGKVTQGTSTGAPNGPWTGAMPGAGGPNAPGDRNDDLNLDNVGPIPGFPGGNTGTSGYTVSPVISPTLPGTGVGQAPAAPAAGAGGFGAGFGSFGQGGPSQTGAGAQGERGAGTRGPGAGPLGEEGALRGRGAAAAGAGRGGAGGPMGAGAGARDEDDEEHDRPSYLVEADPEGTFGTDELTAPPVIGQD
jgi:hypothetical protein